MAAKRKSPLARRVDELEEAVTRLFTGVAPPGKRKRRKAKKAKVVKRAKKAARKAKTRRRAKKR
jgi:hypothetical protein